MSGSALQTVADYQTPLRFICQEKLKSQEISPQHNLYSFPGGLRILHRTVKVQPCRDSLALAMASTSSSTLSISSSSTLVDGKAPRQSPASSPQCVSLPTLPPPPVQSQTRPSKTAAFCRKIARNVMAMATTSEAPAAEVATTEFTVGEPPEIVKTIQEAWDKVEDKYAVSSLAVAGFVALWGSAGVISAIDRLPLIPGILEVVGIGYSGWYVYNNILFKPDREAFVRKIKETYSEIIGSS